MEKTSVTIYVTVAWFYLLARKQAKLIPLVTWHVCVYCLSASCFYLFIYLFIFYHHAADGLSCADVAFQAFESSVCNWSICNPNISLLLTQGYY